MRSSLTANRTALDDIIIALVMGAAAFGISESLNAAGVFSPGAALIAMLAGTGITMVTGYDYPGAQALVRRVLPVAIVLLGFGLDVSVLTGSAIGLAGLAAIGATIVVSFAVSLAAARIFRIDRASALAIGAGGAICGNTAVLAVAPSLRIKSEHLALILAAINLLGLAGFLAVIVLSDALGLDQAAAGVWAGASIHAVPQAIAAGEALGGTGLALATAVKLTRVSGLVLVVPVLALTAARMQADEDRRSTGGGLAGLLKRYMPWYVPGFILAAVAGNLFVPDTPSSVLEEAGRLALLPILAAVGMRITRGSLMSTGGRMILVGGLAAVALSAASLGAILALS